MPDNFDKLLSGVDRIIRDAEAVEKYDARLARLTAEHITGGKPPEVAEAEAKRVLADEAPTEGMRFNLIRARVLREQTARRQRGDATLNPALEGMALRSRP